MRSLRLFLPFATLALFGSAHAGVTVVRDVSQAGFSSLAVLEDFESAPKKDAPLASYTHNGVTYDGVSGSNVYIASPGYDNFGTAAPTPSSVLTSNGDEDFRIVPSGLAYRIGFDGYFINAPGLATSVAGAPNVRLTVTTASNSSVFDLAPPATNFGFVGVVSSEPILSVEWYGAQGHVRNTGIDDVRLSSEAVPEPASLAILGLGALGLARRRR